MKGQKKLKKPRINKVAVYIDDNRTPIESPQGYEWVVIRNYEEFTSFITTLYKEEKIIPSLISFDHDLTMEYMAWYFDHPGERIIDYTQFKTKSGMHCAVWFIETCLKNNIDFSGVLFAVHSHNELGTKNLQEYLNKAKGEKYGLGRANTFLQNWPFEYDQKEIQKQQKEHNDRVKEIS